MASRGTGLVVGSRTVRAVEVRKKGAAVQLTRVVSLRLDPSAGDPLTGPSGGAVTASLAGERLRPGPAILGLTGKDLVIRYTQVPPVPDWKLETLMRFEIDEVSQQSGGDVSADYAVMNLPAGTSADTSVLVAMVKNSLLNPRVKLLERLKQKVLAAVPNSLLLFNAFLWYGKVKAGETALLVKIGAQNMDISIQKDGNLLFARNVSGGGEQFTDAISQSFSVGREKAEKMKRQKGNVTPKSRARYKDSAEEKIANAIMGVAGQILSTIQSSIMFARAQTRLGELAVDRIVLAGGGAGLKGLREYLETNLGLPVEVFDPLPAVDVSALPPEERQLAEADPAGLAVALGAATIALEGGGAFWVEILPESYRKKREFVRGPLFGIMAAALAILLVVILFFTASRDDGDWAAAVKKADDAISSATRKERVFKTRRARLEELTDRHVALREIAALNPTIVRGLEAVQEQLVKEITLDEVRIDWQTLTTVREVPVPGSRTRTRKEEVSRRVPWLVFKGEIRGRERGQTWSRFIEAVKDTELNPGIVVKDKPLSGQRIDFRVSFPEVPSTPDEEGR
jgi:type IV pilus assembly protein PilM